MAIDARISSVRRRADKTELTLEPRRDRNGQLTCAGRRHLLITKNPNYEPQVGDEIWGNAHEVWIGEHDFRRIMQKYDGSFETL